MQKPEQVSWGKIESALVIGRWRIHAPEAFRAIQKVDSEEPPEHQLPLVPPRKRSVKLANPGVYTRAEQCLDQHPDDLIFARGACLAGSALGNLKAETVIFLSLASLASVVKIQ